MEKRGILLGTYDTAANLWTLAGWELTDAEQVLNFVDVPGRRKGPLDMSTSLTDGDPVYGSRTLTIVLESSEGTRLERKERIDIMTNALDGWRMNILLPDDPTHYITGRVSVRKLYNDLAHASVEVTAICEPWRYNETETVATFTAAPETQAAVLLNNGRLAVVPLLEVSGGEILLASGTASWALGVGTYALPDLLLQGERAITYSGTGVLTFTYREAVL